VTESKITGMTCDSCASHVKKALEDVPGVQLADVSYARGSAQVAIETATSPDQSARNAGRVSVGGILAWRVTLHDSGRSLYAGHHWRMEFIRSPR
jgi:mercuric reductase